MGSEPVQALVAGATRAVLAGRLVAAALTLLTLPQDQPRSRLVAGAVLLAAVLSSLALHRWQGVGSLVLRHPLVLGLDAVLVVVVLGLVGSGSPWLLATLSTAVLAGLFYGRTGALVFGVVLLAGHALGLLADLSQVRREPTVLSHVVVPLLLAAAAATAAAVRTLLEGVAASAQAARRGAARAAAADERARLARELHDSVAKTLLGVAMSAQSLQHLARTCPEQAGARAGEVARAAVAAAQESRTLLSDLRADAPDEPLAATVRALVEVVTVAAGLVGDVEVDDAVDGELAAGTRYELVAVLREALDNVARHARASRVRVRLRRTDDGVELLVEDDGVGLAGPVDPQRLSRSGHHGVLGMTERASRVGGVLHVVPADSGTGTAVRLVVRLGQPAGDAAPDGERVPAVAVREPA